LSNFANADQRNKLKLLFNSLGVRAGGKFCPAILNHSDMSKVHVVPNRNFPPVILECHEPPAHGSPSFWIENLAGNIAEYTGL